MPIMSLTLPGLRLPTNRPKTSNLKVQFFSGCLAASMKNHRPQTGRPNHGARRPETGPRPGLNTHRSYIQIVGVQEKQQGECEQHKLRMDSGRALWGVAGKGGVIRSASRSGASGVPAQPQPAPLPNDPRRPWGRWCVCRRSGKTTRELSKAPTSKWARIGTRWALARANSLRKRTRL
jgi:hypothetical protein